MGCCTYNFDEIIDRKHQLSKKWTDWSKFDLELNDEIIPLWIADMDFKCEPKILEALHKTVDYGVIGYDAAPRNYFDSFIDWQKRRNHWQIEKEWLVSVPGIVPGISNAIINLSNENDGILIQPPVYYPFFKAIDLNRRKLVENDLIREEHQYRIDFEDLEQKAKQAKMMILCNPHNPVGRVYTREELLKIGEICLKNDVIIISDEIHSDLILSGYQHTPIASLSKEIMENTVTLCAPSKSFNVAGLIQSVAIIPNKELRDKFCHGLCAFGIMHMASFGITGFQAAYTYGEEWLGQAMKYIESNVDYVVEFLKNELPSVKAHRPEGTFLMWFDFREISEDVEVLNHLLIHEAKVLLDSGHVFGKTGIGFYRVNVGCTRALLEDALNRIKNAVNKHLQS